MQLSDSNTHFLQMRRRDDVGDVFEFEGQILRGINPPKVPMVRRFLDGGLYSELFAKALVPRTRISHHVHSQYGMILEHERIHPVVYPQEWTFSMLKDAAIAVLDTAQIALRHGFNMKDCHSFNVLFDRGSPRFIDFGSFHETPAGIRGWQAYEEFLRCYAYPLEMWRDGLEHLAHFSIFSARLMPHSEYLLYKYPRLRRLTTAALNDLVDHRMELPRMSYNPEAVQWHRFVRRKWNRCKMLVMERLGCLEYQNLARLRGRIECMNRKDADSQWKNYHGQIKQKKRRFDRIIELVNLHCHDAQTTFDAAGNQGLFSRLLLEKTNIRNAVVQDLDEQALDIGYRNKTEGDITYVHYNIMGPIVKTTHPSPQVRFSSDIVFALALAHHLILSQGFSVDDIFKELACYSKKYICIEFMPKGLWVHGAPVRVPAWYTQNWFREQFQRLFDLLVEESIDDNYIVYIGKVRHG